jgi:hypothetical protein
MMNFCGGFVFGTTSSLTSPGSVRQVNGAGVAGTGLGSGADVAVAIETATIWVVALRVLFNGKHAESTARIAA